MGGFWNQRDASTLTLAVFFIPGLELAAAASKPSIASVEKDRVAFPIFNVMSFFNF
jgi:hypothetical protein